jgi:hypothetical protein
MHRLTSSLGLLRRLVVLASISWMSCTGSEQPTCTGNGVQSVFKAHVLGKDSTRWPCCKCGEAQLFFAVIQSGQLGHFITELDRSMLPEDLWSTMTVLAAQSVELSGKLLVGGSSPLWGDRPLSFAVRQGKLSLQQINIAGGVQVNDGQLSLSNCMLGERLTSRGDNADLQLDRVIFGSHSLLSIKGGTISIKRSELQQSQIEIGNRVKYMNVEWSQLGSWPRWRAAAVEQSNAASIVLKHADVFGDNGALIGTVDGGGTLICVLGWSGIMCDKDLDECASNNAGK